MPSFKVNIKRSSDGKRVPAFVEAADKEQATIVGREQIHGDVTSVSEITDEEPKKGKSKSKSKDESEEASPFKEPEKD